MPRAALWLLAVCDLALAACHPDVCDPTTFGTQCDLGSTYLSCGHDESTCSDACWGERNHILEHECPTWAPTCADRDTTGDPAIVCLGELLGSCTTEGFVRCDSDNLMVRCILGPDNTLVLSRGPCGATLHCDAVNGCVP